MPDAEVTFHAPPGDAPASMSGALVDTPDAREALEALAIPRCAEWRAANPERQLVPYGEDGDLVPAGEFRPAPYCCSAYCLRCAGLRALDGVEPLTPNQWMENQ